MIDMITYEQICARNRRLFDLLESLTTRMKRDQPEGSEYHDLERQIKVVKFELELNLDKTEAFLMKARHRATPYNFITVKKRRSPRHHIQAIKDLESGKVYRSVRSASKDVGVEAPILWSKVNKGIFFM